jgi:hypothetical protein
MTPLAVELRGSLLMDHTVRRLSRVGGHDRLQQRARDTQAGDGEGLGEPFAQAGGGVRVHPLELAGEGTERGFAGNGVVAAEATERVEPP